MELKHEWNELQTDIISALIKVIRGRRFEISCFTVFAIQNILQKRQVEFYDAWGEINALYAERYNSTYFWKIALCQAAGGVLYKPADTYSGKKEQYDFFKDVFFSYRCLPDMKPLPVRIPDSELFENATSGNLAKTILLYDMAATQGAKLKNIYHAMLNHYEYEKVMFLNERYGGLEQIDRNALEYHFLFGKCDAGKEQFNRFFSDNFGKENSKVWNRMCNAGILDKQIKCMLDIGIDPDASAFDYYYGHIISLRKLLYFVDEIREAYQYLKVDTEFEMFCKAAEIFVEWEKNNESLA